MSSIIKLQCYFRHILDNQHSYGTIHDTMDIIEKQKRDNTRVH
jgi:hypothetical protein